MPRPLAIHLSYAHKFHFADITQCMDSTGILLDAVMPCLNHYYYTVSQKKPDPYYVLK